MIARSSMENAEGSGPSRTVAAFDFDGTLCPGDSFIPFLRSLVPPLRLARALAASAPGRVSRDRFKAAVVGRTLRGVPLERFAAECDRYSHVLERRLRADVLARARWHQAEGHEVIVVSASPEHYLTPLALRLGFGTVLGTRLEVDDDGLLTGRLLGANCRGPEKVERLRGWLGGEEAFLYAYGDSAGDRELLAAADVALRVTRDAVPPRPAA